LVALFDKNDQYHRTAASFFEELDPQATKCHTSNYVVDETITRIRIQDGHRSAVTFGSHFFMSKLFFIHYIEQELEQEAFELFKKYADQKLSFTDCTSFALMKHLGIKKAFSFDDDFAKVGFEIVNPV